MRIAVVGVCQVYAIADALAHLLDDCEILAFEGSAVRNAGQFDRATQILAESDVILAHRLPAEFGPLSAPELLERHPNTVTIPNVSFTGFHPDCIYITCQGKQYASPVGVYNSAIVAASFALGLAEERVPRLFNSFIYQRLGYLDEFPRAERVLRQALADWGMDVAREWSQWMAQGPFMHTINHPRACLLASVAKVAAAKAGLVPVDAPIPKLSYDFLAQNTIWPVYPELARRIDVPGSLAFKRVGGPDLLKGHGVMLPLPKFIAGSYRMYADYPPEVFALDVVARVRRELEAVVG